MNIYFTKYANDKFEILKRHEMIVGKEEVEDIINMPDLIDESKAPLIFVRKKSANRCLRVVYKKEEGVIKVITFYPIYEETK